MPPVCHFCRETHKSKAHWLCHLMLDRHSFKARESFQKWLDEMRLLGDVFVVTGLENVETSMLLEFLSDNLQSFSNIVFYKPQADICIIVCDRREVTSFMLQPFPNDFKDLNFRPYDSFTKEEWRSLFAPKPGNPHPGPSSSFKRDSAPLNSNLNKRSFNEMGPSTDRESQRQPAKSGRFEENEQNQSNATSKSIPESHNPFTGYYSSDEDDQRWSTGKTTSSSNAPQQNNFRTETHTHAVNDTRSFNRVGGDNYDLEFEKIYHDIMLPKDVRDARKRFLCYMREMFQPIWPDCDIIPVGADFLGFDLESEYFVVYLDAYGITNPMMMDPAYVVSETQTDIDKVRTKAHTTLKKVELDGKLTDLKCEGADKIRFNHLIFRIKCKLLLKPFKMAQTARLCKQLFYMNEKASYLLILVTYWAKQYSGFTARGSCNPFVFNWLIYMFLMLQGSLPPVIELQKSCHFKIIDGGTNVAFAYDDRIFSEDRENYILQKGKSHSIIETLLEWFIFMDDTFGETQTKGINRRHSLVCPRYAELIDKRKFKVCEEHFDPKRHLYKDQKKVRKLWKEQLTQIGFDESTWEALRNLKLPDTFSLQHPLYISENIGLYFDAPFSEYFFSTVRKTRDKLTNLVADGNGSLIAAL